MRMYHDNEIYAGGRTEPLQRIEFTTIGAYSIRSRLIK